MSRGKGKPFQKGNKGGTGRPRTTPEERKIAKLTRTRFNVIVRKYLDMDKDELTKIAKSKGTPVLDLMVISVMNKAIVSGDEKKMNWFLEQLFGKLKENKDIKLSGTVKTETSIDLSKLSDEELDRLLEMANKCHDDNEQ